MNARLIDTYEGVKIEFPRVREWLKSAMAYSTNPDNEEALINGIYSQKYHLWVSDNAACVVQVLELDGQKVCFLYLVGGKHGSAMNEILCDGQKQVEEWAKSQGCKGFYASARPEWERILKRYEFSVQSVNYYKEF